MTPDYIADGRWRRRVLSGIVLWEAAPVALTLCDSSRPEHPIVYCNPAFEGLTGYPRSEVLYRSCWFMAQGAGGDEERAILREGVKNGRTCSAVIRNHTKDGRGFWNRIDLSPVPEIPYLFLAVHQNASRLRELELQLARHAGLEVVGTAASSLIHDFNNVLLAIESSTQMLMAESLSPPASALVKTVAAAGERARAICENVSSFLRHHPRTVESVSLNQVLAANEQLLRAVAGPSARVKFSAGDDLRMTHGNVSELEQVIFNLVVNAAQAPPARSPKSITLRTRNVDDATGQWVQLAVEDNGAGMSPDVQLRIFEPFFTTKAGQGTGLGLASVKRIVEEHQGQVRVHSAPDEGTLLIVNLPAQIA